MLDDADVAIVLLNSTAGTAKTVVNDLRSKGIKVGLLKPRVFRPLPYLEIPEKLKHLKALAVLDKADSVNGYSGPLFSEITSARYTSNLNVKTINYIYGLGGRDVRSDNILEVFNELIKISETEKLDKVKYYLGIKE